MASVTGWFGISGVNGKRRKPETLAAALLIALVTVGARRRHAWRLARSTTGMDPVLGTDDGVLLRVETDGPRQKRPSSSSSGTASPRAWRSMTSRRN